MLKKIPDCYKSINVHISCLFMIRHMQQVQTCYSEIWGAVTGVFRRRLQFAKWHDMTAEYN